VALLLIALALLAGISQQARRRAGTAFVGPNSFGHSQTAE